MLKLPYGVGYIAKDSRNVNRPFIAVRYKGKDEKGNSRYIRLGSYATEEEAAGALMENKDKSARDLLRNNYTMEEVYNSFVKHHKYYSKTYQEEFARVFRDCQQFHHTPYSDITCTNMLDCMDNSVNYNRKKLVKMLFNRLDEEANVLNIGGQRVAMCIGNLHPTEGDIKKRDTKIFTDQEIALFKEHQDDEHMDLVLVLLYTGVRKGELIKIKKENVYLDRHYMIGGNKTKNGRNRKIPIHPWIEPILKRWMDLPGTYLYPVMKNGEPITDSPLSTRFKKAIAPYAPGPHHPHETRHTFITRLYQQGVPFSVVEKIVGHKVDPLICSAYCHDTPEDLYNVLKENLW